MSVPSEHEIARWCHTSRPDEPLSYEVTITEPFTLPSNWPNGQSKETFRARVIGLIEHIQLRRKEVVEDVVATIRYPRFSVTVHDALTCKPGEWLNDSIISYFCQQFICATDSSDGIEKNVAVMNSYFFSKLMRFGNELKDEKGNPVLDEKKKTIRDEGYDYQGVKKWWKRIGRGRPNVCSNPLDMDKIIFIINQHNTHWAIVAVFPKRKSMEYIDSAGPLGRAAAQYLHPIVRWLADEVSAQGLALPPFEKWTFTDRIVGRQENGYDCGVFATVYTMYILDGRDIHLVNQDLIHQFRLEMFVQIMVKWYDENCAGPPLPAREPEEIDLTASPRATSDQPASPQTRHSPRLPARSKQPLMQHHLTRANISDRGHYEFLATGYEEDPYYRELEEYDYQIVDVKGDGNCGYYAIFLGLCDVDKKQFSSLKGQGWRTYLATFRKRLSAFMKKKAQDGFYKANRKEIWFSTHCGWDNEKPDTFLEDIENAHEDGMTWKDYTAEDFVENRDKHFLAFCNCIFISMMVGVRIILIYRQSMPGKDGKQVVEYCTYVIGDGKEYSKKNQVKFQGGMEVYQGIYRMPEEEFYQVPTIEIFNLNKTESEEVVEQHFLFLYRLPPTRKYYNPEQYKMEGILRYGTDFLVPSDLTNDEYLSDVDSEEGADLVMDQTAPKKINAGELEMQDDANKPIEAQKKLDFEGEGTSSPNETPNQRQSSLVQDETLKDGESTLVPNETPKEGKAEGEDMLVPKVSAKEVSTTLPNETAKDPSNSEIVPNVSKGETQKEGEDSLVQNVTTKEVSTTLPNETTKEPPKSENVPNVSKGETSKEGEATPLVPNETPEDPSNSEIVPTVTTGETTDEEGEVPQSRKKPKSLPITQDAVTANQKDGSNEKTDALPITQEDHPDFDDLVKHLDDIQIQLFDMRAELNKMDKDIFQSNLEEGNEKEQTKKEKQEAKYWELSESIEKLQKEKDALEEQLDEIDKETFVEKLFRLIDEVNCMMSMDIGHPDRYKNKPIYETKLESWNLIEKLKDFLSDRINEQAPGTSGQVPTPMVPVDCETMEGFMQLLRRDRKRKVIPDAKWLRNKDKWLQSDFDHYFRMNKIRKIKGSILTSSFKRHMQNRQLLGATAAAKKPREIPPKIRPGKALPTNKSKKKTKEDDKVHDLREDALESEYVEYDPEAFLCVDKFSKYKEDGVKPKGAIDLKKGKNIDDFFEDFFGMDTEQERIKACQESRAARAENRKRMREYISKDTTGNAVKNIIKKRRLLKKVSRKAKMNLEELARQRRDQEKEREIKRRQLEQKHHKDIYDKEVRPILFNTKGQIRRFDGRDAKVDKVLEAHFPPLDEDEQAEEDRDTRRVFNQLTLKQKGVLEEKIAMATEIAKLKYHPKDYNHADPREHFVGLKWDAFKKQYVEVPRIYKRWVEYYFDVGFVDILKNAPGIFMTVPAGSARLAEDDDCPSEILTSVAIVYRQGTKNFCLVHSLANCLHYCGLVKESVLLLECAERLSSLSQDLALGKICEIMIEIAPVIGQCQKFNMRSGKRRKRQTISLEELVNTKSAFPTLVIPQGNDGSVNHACCVVDDLVFDASLDYALKLNFSSFNWICGQQGCSGIFRALRFQGKQSLPGVVVTGKFERTVQVNWK